VGFLRWCRLFVKSRHLHVWKKINITGTCFGTPSNANINLLSVAIFYFMNYWAAIKCDYLDKFGNQPRSVVLILFLKRFRCNIVPVKNFCSKLFKTFSYYSLPILWVSLDSSVSKVARMYNFPFWYLASKTYISSTSVCPLFLFLLLLLRLLLRLFLFLFSFVQNFRIVVGKNVTP
jgi:hypothetical protein